MKQARAGHSYHLNYHIHPTAMAHGVSSLLPTSVRLFGAVWSGRNDPELGAERPRNWGGTTAFGADVGRIDRKPGRYTLLNKPTHVV